MNKRELAKVQTKKQILIEAKRLFTAQGVMNTTTLEIAKACGKAHGTLFLHFENKDVLIEAIFEKEFIRIGEELNILSRKSAHLEELLDEYLMFLEKEEDFIAMVYTEFPLYPGTLRRKLLSFESMVRHFFYYSLKNEIQRGEIKKVEITPTLTFLFGTIHYYLVMRKIFVKEGSVIAARGKEIKETFLCFLKPQEE